MKEEYVHPEQLMNGVKGVSLLTIQPGFALLIKVLWMFFAVSEVEGTCMKNPISDLLLEIFLGLFQ